MPLLVSELITEVRSYCGVDANDLTDAQVLVYLNEAWWEILNKFLFYEKEKETTISLTVGVAEYTLPAMYESVKNIYIINPNNNTTVTLTQIETKEYDNDRDTLKAGMPTNYLRFNDKLIFSPTPDQAYTVKVRHYITLDDLTNNPDRYPEIPHVWHEIIKLGAVRRVHLRFRDYQSAAFIREEQTHLISTTTPAKVMDEKDTSGYEFSPVYRPMKNW